MDVSRGKSDNPRSASAIGLLSWRMIPRMGTRLHHIIGVAKILLLHGGGSVLTVCGLTPFLGCVQIQSTKSFEGLLFYEYLSARSGTLKVFLQTGNVHSMTNIS